MDSAFNYICCSVFCIKILKQKIIHVHVIIIIMKKNLFSCVSFNIWCLGPHMQ